MMNKRKWELPLFFILSFTLMILGAWLYNLLDWDFFSLYNLKFGPAILWLLMIFSPTISAFAITRFFRGNDGVRELYQGYFKFRVNWIWYLAAGALLLVPLLIGWILSLFSIGGGAGIDPQLSFGTFIGWMVFNFFSGPFAEEAGWRGFALPRLQSKNNSLVASLILAFFWTLWHVPLAFVSGADQASLGAFGWMIYTILVFTITIILTWLYNNTRGSLVIVIVAHYAFNLGSNLVTQMLGLVNTMTYNILGGIAGVTYLVLIFVGFGITRFSKIPESELPIVGDI